MKMFKFDDEVDGGVRELEEIPEDLVEDAMLQRHEMLEAAAEFDEELLDLFVEDEEISAELALSALRAGTLAMEITPVLVGSALKHKGVRYVLDATIELLPSPQDIAAVVGKDPASGDEISRDALGSEPLAAMAFKTIAEQTGDLTFVRVYSGILEKGMKVLNPRLGRMERIGRIVRIHANKREQVDSIPAGEIAAVVGLKQTITGDTLCEVSMLSYSPKSEHLAS